MSFVDVTPDGHWMWTGSRCGLSREYGQTSFDGARMVAHRAVWLLERGALARDLDLLHQCGRTLCVNPAHVRPGTHAENIREAIESHGSWAVRGEDHPRAVLTWAKVADIRARRSAGELQRVLAVEYGVSQVMISQIVRGKKWVAPHR